MERGCEGASVLAHSGPKSLPSRPFEEISRGAALSRGATGCTLSTQRQRNMAGETSALEIQAFLFNGPPSGAPVYTEQYLAFGLIAQGRVRDC